MKLMVFGSTGRTGIQIIRQALDEGHTVTAIARNPAALAIKHSNLEVVKGDVLQPATFDAVTKGQDVVLSAIGVSSTKPTTVYSKGVFNMVQSMEQHEVKRIICISASAVETSPKLSLPVRMMTKVLQGMLKNMYRDLLKMEQVLRQSDLEWTVVRPPKLTGQPVTGKYRFAFNDWLPSCLHISRADLAHFMLHHIENVNTYKSVIEVAN
jgi:putative NADH-flavin reductase